MIITRSPLRIPLGGGGSDLPSYYRKYGGFVISAAIDKYVYLALHQTVVDEMIIKYSKMERVKNIDDIQHPIIREALKLVDVRNINLEITSMADIPAGTGLGSSSSFTTALLKALHTYKKNIIHPGELAEQACHIEIDMLKEPIGKQDQFVSSFGGINCYEFRKDDNVVVTPLRISEETLFNLEDNLLMFFTGYTRAASSILQEQDSKSKEGDGVMIDNLHHVKQMGYDIKRALESGDVEGFAEIMNIHWERKKERSKAMSNGDIDKWYNIAMKNGAIGGKVIGAGGGGVLLFYADDNRKLRHAMGHEGLREIHFNFDFEGCKVVI